MAAGTADVSVTDTVMKTDSIPASLFDGIQRILAAVNDREAVVATMRAVFSLVEHAVVTFTVYSDDEGCFVVYDNYRDGAFWEWQVGSPVAENSLTNFMARAKRPAERHVPQGSSDPWFLDYPDFYGIPLMFEDGMLVRAMTVGVKPGHEMPADQLVYYLRMVGGFCEKAFGRIADVRRAVDAGQTLEREFILQELHDTAIQDIFACELGLRRALDALDVGGADGAGKADGPDTPGAAASEAVPPILCPTGRADLRACLAGCLSYAQEANANMRKILNERSARRWCDLVLVSSLVDGEVEAHRKLSDVQVIPIVSSDAEVGGNLARTVRMFVHECLCNVRKHARASHAVVFARVEDDMLSLSVEDDGQGFVPAPKRGEDARAAGQEAPHFGLNNLRESLRLVGGTLSVESAPGEGCSVRARIRLGGL